MIELTIKQIDEVAKKYAGLGGIEDYHAFAMEIVSIAHQSPAPIPEQVAQASGIEGLTRWMPSTSNEALFSMSRKPDGNYYKVSDVERLLATQSAKQAPVAQEVTQQAAKAETDERAFKTLYSAVMNIPVSDNVKAELEGAPKGFYLLGHRDARHAAADLIAEAASGFREGRNAQPENSDLAPTTSTVSASGALAAADDVRDAGRYRWLRNPDTDVALVLDKKAGWVKEDESIPGIGGYHIYEYRAGSELDTAIDEAMRTAAQAATDKSED